MEFIFSEKPLARDLRLRSFESVMEELKKLAAAPQVLLSPGWDLGHTLDHCARSIEHAIDGFPDLKNPVFRATVGSLAFHVFDFRGQMSHNLTEEIPGDAQPADAAVDAGLKRLLHSIAVFQNWEGELKEHFAYGRLSKTQFERANSMHVANHLAALEY